MSKNIELGIRATLVGVIANAILAMIKIVTGIVGNSYALIADGIESVADIFNSLVVWGGLTIASIPPDANHPYGHGRAESMASVVVSVALLGAGVFIAIQSIHEMLVPHHSPEWYTLLVLVLVITVKETMFRYIMHHSNELQSNAMKGDAWHHRSDALTSVAAFIGISIALIGGKGYERADDYAALVASGIMMFNGISVLRASTADFMDEAVSKEYEAQVRDIAREVPDVLGVEKCRIRKSGLDYIIEIHVMVDGHLTVTQGHDIGHRVKDALLRASLRISEVIVHVEPA